MGYDHESIHWDFFIFSNFSDICPFWDRWPKAHVNHGAEAPVKLPQESPRLMGRLIPENSDAKPTGNVTPGHSGPKLRPI